MNATDENRGAFDITEGVDTDHAFCSVPADKRKSYFSLTVVWTGYVFVITSMMVGGGLAAGLTFRQILAVSIIGNLFLGVIATLVSYISSREGLSFALLTRYSFGLKGSRIASFFVPAVNLGWYIIQAATYGHFIALIFGLGDFGEALCMMASAILMGVFAFVGMNAITILGYVSIPAIVFLSIATSVRATEVAGGFQNILNHVPAAPISLGIGVTAVIGTWILSTSTCIADIMRYAKTPGGAIASALTGLIFGNTLMIVCGALASIAVNDSDLPAVLLSMGLLIPSFILMTTNIFTTNAANLYSNSLNLANSFRVNRRKMIIVILVIAALATLVKPYRIGALFAFLDALGNVVPPLAGIIIADAFLVRKLDFPALDAHAFRNWNPAAFVTWLAALVLSFVVPFELPALVSLVASIILYPICNRFLGGEVAGAAKGDNHGKI
ncbi:MAG: cytosine permease [Planctomycetes bacterium]|nr:cytosine permease [Planctomycetota bacterium]MCD7896509.1 cytosine permease [Planctomycetaceae bacterium]